MPAKFHGKKKWEPLCVEIDIKQNYDKAQLPYPRIYIAGKYKGQMGEAVVKFFLVPCMLVLLLLVKRLNSIDGLMSLATSLLLGLIALFFVLPRGDGDFSAAGKMILVNFGIMILCTMVLAFPLEGQDVEPLDHAKHLLEAVGKAQWDATSTRRRMWSSLFCGLFTLFVNMVGYFYFRYKASRHSHKIEKQLSAGDFKVLDRI